MCSALTFIKLIVDRPISGNRWSTKWTPRSLLFSQSDITSKELIQMKTAKTILAVNVCFAQPQRTASSTVQTQQPPTRPITRDSPITIWWTVSCCFRKNIAWIVLIWNVFETYNFGSFIAILKNSFSTTRMVNGQAVPPIAKRGHVFMLQDFRDMLCGPQPDPDRINTKGCTLCGVNYNDTTATFEEHFNSVQHQYFMRWAGVKLFTSHLFQKY